MRKSAWKRKFVNKISKLLFMFYYRCIFDRHVPMAQYLSNFVRAWEEQQWIGNIPVSKDLWESQYASGHWTYMKQLEELARYSMIVGYFHFFGGGGSILDVGCGEGILHERLIPSTYSRYVGIDLSREAIARASRKGHDKTLFVCEDVNQYVPTESFDAIVFNETLYYFDNPVKVVKRYERCLKEGGIFIVSMFSGERSNAILRRLKTACRSVDEVKITNQSRKWICNVLVPLKRDISLDMPQESRESGSASA
jgi:SAM-dependent methyltransferase